MSAVFKTIDIRNIVIRDSSLRDADLLSPDFIQLRESIRRDGVLVPIIVAAIPDTDRYTLIDGLQRLTASQQLNMQTITAQVCDAMSEIDMLVLQIKTNGVGVPTRPAAYAQAIQKVLSDPKYRHKTEQEISAIIGLSTSTIRNYLKINKLPAEIARMLDERKLTLAHGLALTKLSDKEDQLAFAQKAVTIDESGNTPTAAELQTEIGEYIKQKNAQKNSGAGAKVGYMPKARLRSVDTLSAARETPDEIITLLSKEHPEVEETIEAESLTNIVRFVIDWVLQLDPASIAEAKLRYEQRQAEHEARKAEKNRARLEKKAEAVIQVD